MEAADFSGWATKAGLKCSDGRTIMPNAFQHQDGVKVPLVWQHGHNEPTNVLGYAILRHREEGVWTEGFFNNTDPGKAAKALVQHGDITMLSIYANKLVERSKQVLHGAIREVSLVLSGANPGALIENVRLAHGEGFEDEILEDEAVIYTGLKLEHADTSGSSTDSSSSTSGDGETVRDVYDTLSPKQKELVHFMIGAALESAGSGVSHSDLSDDDTSDDDDQSEGSEEPDDEQPEGDDESSEGVEDQSEDTESDDQSEDTSSNDQSDNKDEGDLAHQEGTEMTRNVFEQDGSKTDSHEHALSHDDLVKIVKEGRRSGSFKDAVLAHAQEYGITDIDMLFPDAKALTTTPEFISRRMEWVATVLDGTKHSPFAKVKSLNADITGDEARAKGYTKGNRKLEEVFGLLKRTTGPATIYKKQKLDRDDILDITDMDVVNWLKAEMRLMIEEEIARAVLVGDGRSALDDDKVKDPMGAIDGTGIRSILNDDDLYAIKAGLDANVSPKDAVKGVVRAMQDYRGSGTPTLFIDSAFLTDIMLEEDRYGRSLYATVQELADKVRVSKVVPVQVFNEYPTLVAIIVNLQDYTIGSNRGGELTSFEDFDIDFNQNKYLQETRLSGGLTKPYSAVVVSRAAGTAATATAPSFDGTTNTITVPSVAGVEYYNGVTGDTLTGDVVITEETEVDARAAEGYYLPSNSTRSWTFTP